MLKKVIISLIILLNLLILLLLFNNNINIDNIYAKTLKVVSVDHEQDLITAVDYNGKYWQFTGVEDYCINDCISIIFDKNNTENINDDIIVKVQYNGWILNK